jgi:hydrogenase maturation factor
VVVTELKLRTGKVPNETLETVVFGRLGVEDRSVILGPSVGEDAALLRLGDKIIAFKSDPITGSVEEVGGLAVYVNANDIATRGAVPKWFLQCILLPEGCSTDDLEKICRQIDSAAKAVGVSVVGGHTEVTPGINRPIVVGSMVGLVNDERFFTTSGAKAGDWLYMTKSAGIEGTAILSSEKRIVSSLGEDFAKRCKALLTLVNVVDECLALSSIEGVSAMHDLTEGGLLGGAWEVAAASSSGLYLDLNLVPVLEETSLLCRELNLDPYRLISSGSILFTAAPGSETEVAQSLGKVGVKFTRIGKITAASEGRFYRALSGELKPLSPPSTDELWRGLR